MKKLILSAMVVFAVTTMMNTANAQTQGKRGGGKSTSLQHHRQHGNSNNCSGPGTGATGNQTKKHAKTLQGQKFWKQATASKNTIKMQNPNAGSGFSATAKYANRRKAGQGKRS